MVYFKFDMFSNIEACWIEEIIMILLSKYFYILWKLKFTKNIFSELKGNIDVICGDTPLRFKTYLFCAQLSLITFH